MEIQQSTHQLYELALFAGAGGGILGGILNNWRCVGAVECEEYPSGVLAQRQNDDHFHPFPIWDDVRTFRHDNPDTREFIEWLRSVAHRLVVTGGFPCQDISVAGKGEGLDGERSGLWFEMARIIGEIRPRHVFVENSPMLLVRGMGRVLGSLSEMGYNARWGVVSAADTRAPHLRERIWIYGYPNSYSESIIAFHDEASGLPRMEMAHAASERFSRSWQLEQPINPEANRDRKTSGSFYVRERREWPVEPCVGRVADGVADRMDRLKAIGNGQVSRVVRLAWSALSPE